jgi:hypothetical protein
MKEKRHTLHAYLGLMVEARHYLETSDSRARHRGWVDRYEALRGTIRREWPAGGWRAELGSGRADRRVTGLRTAW